jgi:transposase
LSLQELREYIEDKYDVRFQSSQSYYTLLDEAKISWKKTQKNNPQKNDKLVETKKIEIERILEENREEIADGILVVYMIDECHLKRGDVCGYVWGKTNTRVEVSMTNQRERQTYFGDLNYQTKQFFVREYGAGNSATTVLFVKYLQSLNTNTGARILIFWDGASYHKYAEMREYLGLVNQNSEKSEWLIRCELFAPNAPEQNPVEDIWLRGKYLLREHWYICKSFPLIKKLFMLVTHCHIFDLSKLNM